MQIKNKQDRTMNNLFTHYPVNWIDGMKLSSSHFIAVQDFVDEWKGYKPIKDYNITQKPSNDGKKNCRAFSRFPKLISM